jgi:hypothetical protein
LQYYAPIQIGGQMLNSIIDTGSTELVVVSTTCKTGCGEANKLFEPSRSQKFIQGSFKLKLSYGSGSITGQEAYDTVQVGDNIRAKNVPFWETYRASMPLIEVSDFQVILGVGPIPDNAGILRYGENNKKDDYAIPLYHLGINRFGTCLGREPMSPGYFIWNDDSANTDPSKFVKLRVPKTGFWMAKLEDLRLGNRPMACQKSACGATLDSGSSLITAPYSVKLNLEKAIRSYGAGCTTLHKLPQLSFKLDGVAFSLPAEAYFGKNPDGPADGANECRPTLAEISMTTQELGDMFILGVPFFRKYYAVFEQGALDGSRPPAMYVSKANGGCFPSSNPSAPEPFETRLSLSASRARTIDMSKVRVGPWLRRIGKPVLDRGHRRQGHNNTNV